MAKNNKKTSEVQTGDKFKRHKLVIGSTVGSDCSITNIKGLIQNGATYFQIMAKFNYNTGAYIPSPLVKEYIKEDRENKHGIHAIIHMPFYFHMLQKPTQKYMSYFSNLDRYWKNKQEETAIIAHCKGIGKGGPATLNTLMSNVLVYANLCPHMKILLENDAGSKINKAPTLKQLVTAIHMMKSSGVNVGLCVDTEHAYAAGDSLFSINFREDVDCIHMNAIPKEVIYGRHLDRHSKTPLRKSKNGINFIRKILSVIHPQIPLILERTSYEIVLEDIKTLRAMANEKILDVDKKTVGKVVQKKRKIFF